MIWLIPHPFRNLFAWNFPPLEIDISDNTRFQKNLLPSNDPPPPPENLIYKGEGGGQWI